MAVAVTDVAVDVVAVTVVVDGGSVCVPTSLPNHDSGRQAPERRFLTSK